MEPCKGKTRVGGDIRASGCARASEREKFVSRPPLPRFLCACTAQEHLRSASLDSIDHCTDSFTSPRPFRAFTPPPRRRPQAPQAQSPGQKFPAPPARPSDRASRLPSPHNRTATRPARPPCLLPCRAPLRRPVAASRPSRRTRPAGRPPWRPQSDPLLSHLAP